MAGTVQSGKIYIRAFALLSLCVLTTTAAAVAIADPSFEPGLAPPAQEEANSGFAGTWSWSEGDDRFTLNLSESGGRITGSHSAVREGGNHVDSAGTGTNPSITGEAHGPVTVVRFVSGAPGSESYGHARLTLRGRYLYWQLIDSAGDHYLPQNAVLIRSRTGGY